MREGVARILLVVAPSIIECYRTVQYFGIDLGEHAGQLRYISRPYSLIGWKRGTPFVTRDRDSWSTETGIALDQALWALTRSGQLRIAGEHDLAPLRPCLVAAALPKSSPIPRISQG
ncbi:hypothetical protein [Sinorhizobium meliloti]|uniref:hypothetical protein n=1 Tax=Rhizobium meliloti TaxID=382 RepID=UPI0004297890|nr:hypothetical protein [Sinorhizobium meliloti]MDX1150190.1 hypothetical protein [Sinorhizobium medicae]UFX07291.1 hypothetical protein SmelRRI128_12540 [Sinorhizobium meliloti]